MDDDPLNDDEEGPAPEWSRPQFQPGGGDAFVFFTVFGPIADTLEVSATQHRFSGANEFLAIRRFSPDEAAAWLSPPLGRVVLARWQGKASEQLAADGCAVLRGTVPDPPNLRYMRDSIGIVTALLDGGGHAALNVQSLTLYTPERWRGDVFEPDAALPRNHVSIFYSEDDTTSDPSRQWIHTRGLRIFGRPDVSIRNVPYDKMESATELCNRFIEWFAYGAVVVDGQPIQASDIPEGMKIRHGGDLDDPEFNNVHIGLHWPP